MHVRVWIVSKNQVTLPDEACRALGVGDGDRLEFSIEGDRVTIRKAIVSSHDPFPAFSEWATEADRNAYKDL